MYIIFFSNLRTQWRYGIVRTSRISVEDVRLQHLKLYQGILVLLISKSREGRSSAVKAYQPSQYNLNISWEEHSSLMYLLCLLYGGAYNPFFSLCPHALNFLYVYVYLRFWVKEQLPDLRSNIDLLEIDGAPRRGYRIRRCVENGAASRR